MKSRNFSASLCAVASALVLTAPLLSFADSAPVSGTADTNAAPAPAPAQTAPADTTPAPATPPAGDTNTASADRPSTYTVVSRDSLWKIAHKFGITVVQLRKANNLKKGALLHPGQTLQIPAAPADATAK
jgi:LysM repeat protein